MADSVCASAVSIWRRRLRRAAGSTDVSAKAAGAKALLTMLRFVALDARVGTPYQPVCTFSDFSMSEEMAFFGPSPIHTHPKKCEEKVLVRAFLASSIL